MKKLQRLKKNKLLVLIVLTYIGMYIFRRDKAITSFDNSMYYVIEMLEIMPVVFVLTLLIETWVPKRVIMNSFGENSGVKGYVFSFLLGSLSAGPIYVAFPVCKMLLRKGASVMNIVIILSAWAVVKVPMLANEAKFLGLKFMGIRWILTVISITIMAYLVSKIMGDSLKVVENTKESSKKILKDSDAHIAIDNKYCIGCGICARLAPDNFKVEGGKATVIDNNCLKEVKVKIDEVIDKCPAQAITYD